MKATGNPHIGAHHMEALRRSIKATKERVTLHAERPMKAI